MRSDDEFVQLVSDGAYYDRLELSLFQRSAFTAVLLHILDVQIWGVGEKDGIGTEHAIITSTAYDGDALWLPIFIQCDIYSVALADAFVLTNENGDEFAEVGAWILSGMQNHGIYEASKEDDRGVPHQLWRAMPTVEFPNSTAAWWIFHLVHLPEFCQLSECFHMQILSRWSLYHTYRFLIPM